PRDPHSFPTRRSSDLCIARRGSFDIHIAVDEVALRQSEVRLGEIATAGDVARAVDDHELLVHPMKDPTRMPQCKRVINANLYPRSEEHTSELQSLAYL